MNIVLTSVHIDRTPDALPLAPALLKGYLDKKIENINTSIIEFTLKDNIKKCALTIVSKNPDIVGLSIYLWNNDFYIKLVKELKSLKKDLIIIAGGAEVRSGYKKLLSSGIDYTLQGEGEEIIYEFINSIKSGKNPLNINGINDDTNRFIKNLNSIPSPLITNNIDLTRYDGYLWELSRGCPFSCDFCFESRGLKGVRYYDLDRVKEELDIIIKAKTPQVFVLDPTFNKDLNRAKTILRLIKKRNRGTHFHFEVRAELLDKEIAMLFSEIGASLQIGIQSGHDEVLKLINRRLNREKFSKKISLLNQAGTIFGLDLIYGLPGDSYKGFKESMEYVLSLQPNHIDIFPLSVLPGTALCDNATTLNLNYLKKPPYTVIESPTYSKSDMNKSKKLKDACDYIYNRGKSTGWLSQVCKELKISLTDFIEKFSTWSQDKDLEMKGTEAKIIKQFIKKHFNSKNMNLIFDIINYHSSYSKALLSEKNRSNIPKNQLLKSKVSLSNTVSIGQFNYDILDAFDSGCYEIQIIKQMFRPSKSRFISWFHTGGDVMFDCYSDDIMFFLDNIDAKKTAFEIDKRIDPEFLLFAQESGMLIFN